MKRALISVSDKSNLIPFVKGLVENGYEIISTGGTKKALDEAGIKTISISDVTNFPEILDGRVKTLHPNVHAGLLAIRDNINHQEALKELKIEHIDLVVVNLYPFKATVAKQVSFAETIEMIDIGGPSMLRSAAKNHAFVTVICDPNDYDSVLQEIKTYGDTKEETRLRLAAKVFRHTASYDTYIANYLSKEANEVDAMPFTITFDEATPLRYGENPHQNAIFYKGEKTSYSLAHAHQYQGKELSYNNIQDANATLQVIREFDQPAVVAVKHMNPCGVGIGKDINEAWTKAFEADKVSIFGGIVSSNNTINEEVASKMADLFLEVIIAPSYTSEALQVFSKKKNLRVLSVDMDNNLNQTKQYVSVNGGMIVQDIDSYFVKDEDIKIVTKLAPTKQQLDDLLFAMKVCKHVKSNAIVVASNNMTLGIGAGQMNRVASAKIALEWAKENHPNEELVLASDAFFPFDDVVKLAAKYNVKAIIQPGGSIRDADSIKACDELGIAMIFTGMRHFKH